MPIVEFVGQSRKNAEFSQGNTSRLINCYREPDEEGHVLKSVPGTALLANLSAVFMRDMAEIDGDIYAVCGGALFKVERLGDVTNLGAVADGDATVSGNNGKVTVAAGGTYYVWNGTTLSAPTGGAFSSVGSVEFVGQITIMTEKDGRRFQWTSVADPTTLNALDFATAEGRDDDILRAVVINGNVWLMKQKSCEIWYQTAAGFSRINGGVLDTGLKAFGLVAKFDGGAFFVGDDGIAYVTNGAGLQPVSAPAVEVDIARGAARRCFYYEDRGHKFCVIQFSDRPSWVYDISTGEWHNRATGPENNPWRMVSAVKAWGHWHVGSDLGQVLRLLRINTDFDQPLYRTAVSKTLRTGKRNVIDVLEMIARTGEMQAGGSVTYTINGVTSTLGATDGLSLTHTVAEASLREPQAMLRISRDGGKTWGPEKRRGFGVLGDYAARVIWRGLGQGRTITAELTISDAVELPVKAVAFLEAS